MKLAGERNQVVFTFRWAFVYGFSEGCSDFVLFFFLGWGGFEMGALLRNRACAMGKRGGLVEATMANFVRSFRSLFWVKRFRWGEGVSIESYLSDCWMVFRL